MGSATMIRMHWRRCLRRSRVPCTPKAVIRAPEPSRAPIEESGHQERRPTGSSCLDTAVCRFSPSTERWKKGSGCGLLLLSRLEGERRIWFVHNAGLTVFHLHKASLWGRDGSSLYSYL